MPVTKTAKRALRSSAKKEAVNKKIASRLDASIRIAKKSKLTTKIYSAISLTDQAAKKNLIHPNKAARIKSALSKLLSNKKSTPQKKAKSKKA